MTASTVELNVPAGDDEVTVPRESELELIRAEIDKRTRELTVPRSVILLFGTAGIGKTTFLNKSLVPLLNEEFPTLPWAKLDFDKEAVYQGEKIDSRYDCQPGRGRLLIDIVNELFASIEGEPPPEFTTAQKSWEAAAANWTRCAPKSNEDEQSLIDAEEELVVQFEDHVIPQLVNQPGRRPVVIILDTVEELDDKFMSWLQTSLQAPTIKQGSTLWIMAGRFFVETRAFFLTRSYHRRRLSPFSREQVGIQLQLPADDERTGLVYHYSHGHPAAAKRVAAAIPDRPDVDQSQADQAAIDALVRYVEDKRVLGGLDTLQTTALELLSVLRLINLGILTQLLPDFLRRHPGNETIPDPETIMGQLKAAKLVDWNRERRAYNVEEPLRQILADILKHRDNALYQAINKHALSLFNSWFRDVAEKRRDYLLEAIYHQAVLAGPRETGHLEPVKALLTEAVDAFYADKGFEAVDGLGELSERLRRDEDLIPLFSPEQFEDLLAVVEQPDAPTAANAKSE